MDFSSVAAGAGAGAGTGPSAVGAGAGPSAVSAVSAFPHFLPFFLQDTELDTEVFGVVMKTLGLKIYQWYPQHHPTMQPHNHNPT